MTIFSRGSMSPCSISLIFRGLALTMLSVTIGNESYGSRAMFLKHQQARAEQLSPDSELHVAIWWQLRKILSSRIGAPAHAAGGRDEHVQERLADFPRVARRARTLGHAPPSFEQHRNDRPTLRLCADRST